MNKLQFVMAFALVTSIGFVGVTTTPYVETSIQTIMPNVIFASALSGDPTHTITMTAETLPNGQDAYQVISHTILGEGDVTDSYSGIATIPGPTLILKTGDTVKVTLTNNIVGKSVGFNVPGLLESNAKTATGQSKVYEFTASNEGTFHYQNKGDAYLGLFGAIIVNPTDGEEIGKYVADGNGAITEVDLDELDREYVLFMVGSTFWGQEISSGDQTPLWTNPTLGTDKDELVRFHVIAIGNDHTFHMHAHRWVESSTNDNIIDTKLLNDGSRHSFIVQSGADVGEGMWQYHCHVFPHMQSGMHGHVHVGDEVSVPGADPYNGIFTPENGPEPGVVTFKITDEPGTWFESARGDALAPVTVSKALEVIRPGDYVNFVMSETDTVHTITSLLWPTGAENMPFDQNQAYKGGGIVQLTEPGLYVFTCKVHPYMFGGVIVDDPETQIELDEAEIVDNPLLPGVLGNIVDENGGLLLDFGQTFSLVNGYQIPTGSDLALRLGKTFFVATAPENWRDYTSGTWNPSYPALPVKASVYLGGDLNDSGSFAPVAIQNLDDLMEFYFDESSVTNSLFDPSNPGVGEVWVNAQFEKTASKTKPGTATAVNATTWDVTKKVALPGYNMNNPHNMWTDEDQTVIYQTEWFSNKLTTFDRETGAPISQMKVGESPSHVMTRPNNDDITVALNGEEGVAEILATTSPSAVNRIIAMQGYGLDSTHPHAQWISSDGQTMITPNAFTHDATIYGFDTEAINSRTSTGILSIATAMTPDDEFGAVANLLSSTISVVDLDNGNHITDINLLGDYNPVILTGINDDDGLLETALAVDLNLGVLATTDVSALPIQTPISPDGQYMVTANTLTATISITDVSDGDPQNWFIAETLPCDPGCHGVQFGAKSGDGYYAYVSSKFANDLIVIDMDTLEIVGRILLNTDVGTVYDDAVVSLHGMGGQGVMPIPNVYNGWVQNLPNDWKDELSPSQKNPLGP